MAKRSLVPVEVVLVEGKRREREREKKSDDVLQLRGVAVAQRPKRIPLLLEPQAEQDELGGPVSLCRALAPSTPTATYTPARR